MYRSKQEVEQELIRMVEWEKLLNTLSVYYSSVHSRNITTTDIFDSLFLLTADKHKLDWCGNLIDTGISQLDATQLLSDFDFTVLSQTITSETSLLPEHLVINFKVQLKAKGLIWVIHRYDADPFPSSPHAHLLDSNIKMDLSNGKCYRTRQYVYTISKKELFGIRQKAATVYKGDLPIVDL